MPQPQSLPGIGENYQSKFFNNDVITRLDDPSFQGKVLRCWADEDMAPLPPLGGMEKALDRPLLRGEIGTANLHTSELSIVPESTFILHQRDFIRGDIVKKTLTSIESAEVTRIKTEVSLSDALTGIQLAGWVELERLRNCLVVEAGDRVVADQWVGTIEEVFEDALIQPVFGGSYRLAEMGGLLEPGRTVAEVMPQEPGYDIPKSKFPFNSNVETDRIVSVRPIILFITWNAINQMVPIAEQCNYLEPPRFWYGADLARLVHFDTTHNHPQPLGSAVCFRDEKDITLREYRQRNPGQSSSGDEIFRIRQARSRLSLKWQDGSETEAWSTDVVPYHNVDDYESWPCEHIVWRGENGERRPAILQTFDAHQRIATIRLLDHSSDATGTDIQVVPALEIDPGGSGREAYGVSHGDLVLICGDNGSSLPHVPTLGQIEPGDDYWWRSEIAMLCEKYEANPADFGQALPSRDTSGIDWWGDVKDLRLDGSVDVLLVNGETRNVGIKQLYLLAEPIPLGMGMGMGMDDEYPPEMGMDTEGPLGYFIGVQGDSRDQIDIDEDMKSQGSWQTESEDGSTRSVNQETDDLGDIWTQHIKDVTSHELEAQFQAYTELLKTHPHYTVHPETGGIPDWHQGTSSDQPASSSAILGPDSSVNLCETQARANGEAVESLKVPPAPGVEDSNTGISSDWPEAGPSSPATRPVVSPQSDQWVGFEMLEEAPSDHHFFAEPRLQSSNKAYLSRLRKEHKALSSSLPENILVRTYEDRTDLMRCLIIGPEGTPYVDAPFVFDLYLNPTKFPQEPPVVHFHSHTNGKGRSNPNLYEDGKVCLSILGTWSGEQSESWSPSSSSLLQVFVSISGLVLVRKPYHCEPAFAKLEGTIEGSINSRLYSEKAYILSRSFVKTALERPAMGFEKELRWYYLEQGGVRRVLDHAERLVRRAEANNKVEKKGDAVKQEVARWDSEAVGDLTMGAVISLKRTIASLNQILESQVL